MTYTARVPLSSSNFIENEVAYEAATARRIKENARKGREKRWLAEDSTRADLCSAIREKAWDSGSKFWNSMVSQIDEWGSLSEKQEAACRRSLDQDETRKAERIAAKRAADAASVHVGKIGERREFTLKLRNVVELESQYGITFVHIMNDADGNVVVYKGSKRLGYDWTFSWLPCHPLNLKTVKPTRANEDYRFEPLERGQTITVKATIKAHGERDGVNQTNISRPAII